MANLLIHWHKNKSETSLPPFSVEDLVERLTPATELSDHALTRLVLRLRASYPISLPLRADADTAPLVSWLTEAGAVVGFSPAPAPRRVTEENPF